VTLAGWGWLAGIAVVSTVAAVSLFFAGLKRVGPTTASILSTVEPVVTVLLAFLVFGETLGAVQLVGGGLVLAAVLALYARLGPGRPGRRRSWSRPERARATAATGHHSLVACRVATPAPSAAGTGGTACSSSGTANPPSR
jgi:O-antigen/teichoic acid export membrane protein